MEYTNVIWFAINSLEIEHIYVALDMYGMFTNIIFIITCNWHHTSFEGTGLTKKHNEEVYGLNPGDMFYTRSQDGYGRQAWKGCVFLIVFPAWEVDMFHHV